MPIDTLDNSYDLRRAFAEYDRQVILANCRVGCILGIIFMPAGAMLDYFVYRDQTVEFLVLRLWCSALLAGVWALLQTRLGVKYYRSLGLIEVTLPIFFISGMIYETEGPNSPYYAGLNLVLMGAGMVLRWTLADSTAVLLIALGMYWGACRAQGPVHETPLFFNNLYFLIVTGVFIMTGNYYYNRMRFREFALRYELDRNRKMLQETNRKLRELDEVKSRFFANISHELRTPLTLLLAPLEALLHRSGRDWDAQARDWLHTMHGNGMRLLKLINDLLDLVRLESGKMEVKREPVDLHDFILGLTNAVRKVADDKRVQLHTDLELNLDRVMVDRDKLEKIVLNLVFNAIKFTPAGGRVTVRAQRQAEHLVLEVQDTGMGIAEADRAFLFSRFWQADTSAKRKYQGAGIGLALVKELIEIQGGLVSATSELGKGTCMHVELPFIKAEAAPPAPAPHPAAVADSAPASTSGAQSEEWLTKLYRRAELIPSIPSLEATLRPSEEAGPASLPKLLIADDEADMLRFLRSQLRGHFQVLEAVDGNQALEKATQFLPDIILCDMMMPEKDGLQVCAELRQRTPTRNIPIVLLTARADEETKLAALSAGANDFLAKPFSMTELHVRLSNLVAGFQLQKQLARQNQVLAATLEELKETETQLVQSEKMASLGRMSAGIIHEINNPLNYAKTALYLLKKRSQVLPEEQQREYGEIWSDAADGVNRVIQIVSDLRVFTHPHADHFETVEVQAVVSDALRFLSNDWRESVRIDLQIPQGQTVWANRNKVVMLLVNLIQNALHAVKKKAYTNESPTIWIEGRRSVDQELVVVRDNGVGIAPEHVTKIFEPFFTTKEVGEGMGLGLSICYRLMEEHGGRISVQSQVGKYCEFCLEFPQKTAS